jgi:hypothetical protein
VEAQAFEGNTDTTRGALGGIGCAGGFPAQESVDGFDVAAQTGPDYFGSIGSVEEGLKQGAFAEEAPAGFVVVEGEAALLDDGMVINEASAGRFGVGFRVDGLGYGGTVSAMGD